MIKNGILILMIMFLFAACSQVGADSSQPDDISSENLPVNEDGQPEEDQAGSPITQTEDGDDLPPDAIKPVVVDLRNLPDTDSEYFGNLEISAPGSPRQIVRLIALVSADLSERIPLDVGEILLNDITEQQWSDTSLGCPQAGMAYATMIVEGYQISLLANDQEYIYNTNASDQFVLCAQSEDVGNIEIPAPGSPPKYIRLITLVSADLSERVPVDVGSIVLKDVTEQQWPNTSLGCPQAGMAYADMIVNGYQITLVVNDLEYTYNTNASDQFVLCVDGLPQE